MATLANVSCPFCRVPLSRSLGTGGSDEPLVGSMSLCFRCHGWSVFDIDTKRRMYLRRPNFVEAAEIHHAPERKAFEEGVRESTSPLRVLAEIRRRLPPR